MNYFHKTIIITVQAAILFFFHTNPILEVKIVWFLISIVIICI